MAAYSRARRSTNEHREWSPRVNSPIPSHGYGNGLPISSSSNGLSPKDGPHILLSSSTASLASTRLFNRRQRRWIAKLFGGGSFAICAIWLALLTLGTFDTNLRLGAHIDPYTFQVTNKGDPRSRAEHVYSKPPDYWEFIDNWNAPSFELLSNDSPSQRHCNKAGPLLFIGMFTTPGGIGRRQILRNLFKPDLQAKEHRIDFKFMLGRPPDDDWKYLLEQENAEFGDLAIIDDVFVDNIDEGKSLEYFEWMVKNLPEPKPQFVMKLDDDTFLVMPNVIRNLSTLDCAKAIYWGTMQGSAIDFYGPYMRGMAYVLSWPLASWIGTANVSLEYASGTEDAKIGKMVQSLDPVKEPVQWVDHGWKMGDWDQLKVNEDLIAFHWLKQDHWIPMVKRKALKAFAEAGREYRWDWDRNAMDQSDPSDHDL